ncbi:MAG: hypothetical protein J1F32_03685 [Erysipelotrichales bacterium]|nr:hypothetical protein [Erysipelotrichales bacterium]
MKNSFYIDPRPYEIDAKQKIYKDFLRYLSEIKDGMHLDRDKCRKNTKYDNSGAGHSNIITVLGGRGSGKTSFLLSVKEYIRKNYSVYYVVNELIEPSGISDSNNILKLILSALFNSYINLVEDSDKNRNPTLLEQFVKLSKYVTRLTKNNESIDDSDDLFALRHIFKIKEEFYKLFELFINEVNECSERKGVEVVTIMIDDMDLNSKDCYEMLEQIRKYLSIHNVIIVLAGNKDDFEYSVRNEYVKNYKSLLPNDDYYRYRPSSVLMDYQKIIEMTNNYLVKILPEVFRIELRNNASNILDSTIKKQIFSYAYIDIEIFEEVFKKDIFSSILGKNLREQIQFFYRCDEYIKDDSIDEDEKSSCIKNLFIDRLIRICGVPYDFDFSEINYKTLQYIFNTNSNNIIPNNVILFGVRFADYVNSCKESSGIKEIYKKLEGSTFVLGDKYFWDFIQESDLSDKAFLIIILMYLQYYISLNVQKSNSIINYTMSLKDKIITDLHGKIETDKLMREYIDSLQKNIVVLGEDLKAQDFHRILNILKNAEMNYTKLNDVIAELKKSDKSATNATIKKLITSNKIASGRQYETIKNLDSKILSNSSNRENAEIYIKIIRIILRQYQGF